MTIRLSKLITSSVTALILSLPLLASADLGTPMPAPMPQVSPQANKGPSLEETLQWIKEKVEHPSNLVTDRNKYQNYTTYHAYEFRYTSCELCIVSKMWRSTNKNKAGPRGDAVAIQRDYAPDYVLAYTLDLADMDNNKIRTTPWYYDDIYGNKITRINVDALGSLNKVNKYGNSNLSNYYGWIDDFNADYSLKNEKTRVGYDTQLRRLFDDIRNKKMDEDRADSFELYFSDPSITERVATALKHAIGICQQQRKETQQPQKKELF